MAKMSEGVKNDLAIMFACFAVMLFTHTLVYYIGRNAEADLTIRAYSTASYALDQLEECTGVLLEIDGWVSGPPPLGATEQ